MRGRREPRDPSSQLPEKLHDGWRAALFVLGVFLLIAASKAWLDPPMKTAFAPQATVVTNATATVPDRSETVTALLVGLAAFLILIAANGRKLTSVEIAGSKFSTDDVKAAGEAKGRAEAFALARGHDPDDARRLGEVAEAKVFTKVAAARSESIDHAAIVHEAVAETVAPPAD